MLRFKYFLKCFARHFFLFTFPFAPPYSPCLPHSQTSTAAECLLWLEVKSFTWTSRPTWAVSWPTPATRTTNWLGTAIECAKRTLDGAERRPSVRVRVWGKSWKFMLYKGWGWVGGKGVVLGSFKDFFFISCYFFPLSSIHNFSYLFDMVISEIRCSGSNTRPSLVTPSIF